ncbi:translation elongation factor 1-beta [Perkinsela sp. CCAP 1560/4]|nr:translation elongation factor 1-beta [Perkinsela sp. CCAP 1560/4]KNH06448.1 translation elongation factor 1-beta [Perkinsela sp. CCAP 1560/4]|eukprot:KNH04003.1 translation elongation factor 1-beta [Perkinsela sp. CCAP 1560/4]
MSLSELNKKLTTKPYIDSYVPTAVDDALFTEMFGSNTATIQWAARMASYFSSERAQIGAQSGKATKPAEKKAAPKAAPKAPAPADDDDDVDLFGDVTEEEQAALAAKKTEEAAAKAKKPAVIAKSNIVIDVKPWDDTVDLEGLMKKFRAIEKDGLLWGAHKLEPIAFGIMKLKMMIVIEDDKISSDDIEDMVMAFEDEVQSMDIAAWNKV